MGEVKVSVGKSYILDTPGNPIVLIVSWSSGFYYGFMKSTLGLVPVCWNRYGIGIDGGPDILQEHK